MAVLDLAVYLQRSGFSCWWAENRHRLLTVAAIFLLSRALYFTVAALGWAQFPEAVVDVVQHFPIRQPIEMHWRLDAVYYYQIAKDGYSPTGITTFFPLFPLLMRIVSLPLQVVPGLDEPQALLVSGLLAPNLVGFAALLLLHRLVALDEGDEVAERVVLYLSFFPYALFFIVPYTESLFLLTTVGCFLALRHQRWFLAGVCGFLATLTRQLGVVLVIPFAWELGAALWRLWRDRCRVEWWRTLAVGVLGLELAPLALLLYMAYLDRLVHLGRDSFVVYSP